MGDLAGHLWHRRHKLLFQQRLSALYHQRRSAFFDRLDMSMSIVTAAAGTSAFYVAMQPAPELAKWLALLTGAFSIVPLVVTPAVRARKHAEWAGEYARLRARCEAMGERWTEAQCDQVAAETLLIQAAEPAPLSALVADCENRLTMVTGGDPPAKLHLGHRLLMHWVDWCPPRAS